MADISTTQAQAGPATGNVTLARRAGLLCVCLVAGLGIGFAGQALTGDSAWFLALPACIAAGWFFVADPTQCVRPQGNVALPLSLIPAEDGRLWPALGRSEARQALARAGPPQAGEPCWPHGRETRPLLGPSKPTQVGLEPRASAPLGADAAGGLGAGTRN